MFDKLKEAHDRVMNHPWRFESNPEYLRDYIQQLYLLRDEFWETIKTVPYLNDNKKFMGAFYHDFGAASYSIKDGDRMAHTERCIGFIHRFIDTGRFDKFATYYFGCNILKSENRARYYEYDETDNTFYPIFRREELDAMIKEIEDYRESVGQLPKFGHKSEWRLEYLLDYKNNHADKLIS